MKLLRGLAEISHFAQGTVASIGNFDGVHLGHQALLSHLSAKASELKLPLVVLLFEPQPAEYFRGQQAPARLTSLREKSAILKSCKVDFLCCLKFNKEFASLPALEFAKRYFFSLLKVKYLLIGEDFRFGRNREGDVQLLKIMGQNQDCMVESYPNFSIANQRVSSTKVREALKLGELEQAKEFLGRVYSLCGRVIKGNRRGREWGIPTANLAMHRLALPLRGVFCVEVKRSNGQILKGVANLGSRPTLDGSKNILEVHIFDFDENLYGEMLEVFFLHKLRDEVKFSSIPELIQQIQDDIRAAKAVFRRSFNLSF